MWWSVPTTAASPRFSIIPIAGAAPPSSRTPSLVKLGSFYTAKPDPSSRRVLVLAKGEVTFDVAEIRYSSANEIILNPLLQNEDAADIAGFWPVPRSRRSRCSTDASRG